jgi:RNA polymerase sigma-70 factor (ECF subfamily)
VNDEMHDCADRPAGHAVARNAPAAFFVSLDQELEREFETRLVESSTLAFRVAFSVLRQREEAEDVAQEAFAKAHRSFRQLRDRERFRAWLVRMTWRMALDRQRSNRRRIAREERAETPRHDRVEADVQVRLESEERAGHLWRAIDGLSEKLRIVIVLSGIQGHDVKEVAALLELPEGTVKSRLFDARRQLKEALAWMATDRRR